MTYKTHIPSIVIILFFLLSSTSACAQTDETSRAWNQPVKPFRVIGNVYYVGALEVSSFLITTPNGHILLDSGLFETVPQIKQNIATLGFKLADVKIIINSHAHYDHAGGLALLKQLTGAKFYASAGDAQLHANGGKGDPNFGDRFPYQPVATDRLLNDGDTVELGGVIIKANVTPGHTRGCTTWSMKAQEGDKTYDVVFVGSASVPGYKLVNNSAYPTIVEDYEKTFHVLKSLKVDVFLACHGSFFSMKEKMQRLGEKTNPFIDPQGYSDYVASAEKTFRTELKRQQSSAQLRPEQERSD
jgi:metallo-beta-lactamase class B